MYDDVLAIESIDHDHRGGIIHKPWKLQRVPIQNYDDEETSVHAPRSRLIAVIVV